MRNGAKVLVSRHSAFQEILLTEDHAGLRTLRFGVEGAAQSTVKPDDPRHLALPYARLVPACLAFVENPRRMLIAGLGGGSLPRFFHHHFPEMEIDVVELDAAVVEVAREYCGLVEDGRLRVHVEDGRDFVETHGSYDVVVLDTYGANSIPPHLSTLEFLTGVRAALSPAGVAIANIWGRTWNPLYAHMILTFRAAFADVHILDVPQPGTKLFVGLQEPRTMSRDTLLAYATAVSSQRAFTYDLPGAIAGIRNSDLETVRGGAILRD